MRKILRRCKAAVFAMVLAAAGVIPAGQISETYAMEPMKINYSGFLANQGWSPVTDDNKLCAAPVDSYLTAFQANLLNQPEGTTGTVQYQVNLSGSGWLPVAENGAQTGGPEGQMPLEAIRMELTGQLKESYDIYYSVLQNGQWSPWSKNGEVSGTEGAGLRLDGVKASVTAKDAGEPAPQPEPPKEEPIQVQNMGAFDASKPMVALTFDDGPNAAVTNRILNTLEANGARATFFMVGNRVTGSANVASVKRMVALGCQVGNHTFEHKNITKLGAAAVKSQLSQTNQVVKSAGGVSPVVMRPPGGSKDGASLAAVGSQGMSVVLWSLDTLDWKTRDKQKTVDAVLNNVKDGDIILMHDLYGTTADAAEVIIPKLIERGYQLVTVSEMASARGGMKAGSVYGSFHK